MEIGRKTLFLKCLLVTGLTGVVLLTMALKYGSRIHGPSLAVIPLILLVAGRAVYESLKLAWLSDGKIEIGEREALVHTARWLNFYAWLAPMIGMMGTVLGIWLVLTSSGSVANIHDRLLNGGGVVFAGTFVGILAAVTITTLHRLLEDALDW